MRYTLICSSSGTGLSRSIEKLVSSDKSPTGVHVDDVERRLCASSALWDEAAFRGVHPDSRSMADVCSKLPRKAVSQYWRQALGASLESLETVTDRPLGLACHLTLFSPHRREFYVPGRPEDFLNLPDGRSCEVCRVVVLIDDIYDMYARLSMPTEVFSEDQQVQNYNDHVKKLSGYSLLDPDTGSPQLLRLEVRRRSLESLAAWRRAELIQAEVLANALGGVPLTVLGVKHRLSSLETLIHEPRTRVVYVSHKITEARRHNRNHPGEWPPFVKEVNSLSAPFEESGIVLLHPTAIDELRTESSSQLISLTDRWPLQEDVPERLIYCPPGNNDPPDYKDLFSRYDFETENTKEQAVAIFRGFELGVFHDIASRDHLLVSSTDGLLLYRPLVVNGEDSGGARAEVAHWLQRWMSEPSRPRLVAIHTFDDIDLRLKLLREDERTELARRIKFALQEQGFDREQAKALLEAKSATSTHLQEIWSKEKLEQEFENAAGIALVQCFFSWLCNVQPSKGRLGAMIVAASSEEELRSIDTVRLVASLLKGDEVNTIAETARHITAYALSRGHETLSGLARTLVGVGN